MGETDRQTERQLDKPGDSYIPSNFVCGGIKFGSKEVQCKHLDCYIVIIPCLMSMIAWIGPSGRFFFKTVLTPLVVSKKQSSETNNNLRM